MWTVAERRRVGVGFQEHGASTELAQPEALGDRLLTEEDQFGDIIPTDGREGGSSGPGDLIVPSAELALLGDLENMLWIEQGLVGVLEDMP